MYSTRNQIDSISGGTPMLDMEMRPVSRRHGSRETWSGVKAKGIMLEIDYPRNDLELGIPRTAGFPTCFLCIFFLFSSNFGRVILF